MNHKNISFELKPGQLLHLKGPNGSGKSLFLKSLARLIPSSWDDLSLDLTAAESFPLPEWRSKILYLPPEVIFDVNYSVEDFLNEPFKLSIYKNFQKTFSPKTYFEDTTKKMVLLSSGQKQQVAILRALSLDPKVLLLDESFAHMDEPSRMRFIELLSDWCSKDKAIVLVSHSELTFTRLQSVHYDLG